MNKVRQTMKEFRQSKRSSVIVFVVLRTLIVICFIMQILRGNFNSAFLSIFAFVLLMFPIILPKVLKITLPNTLEIIIFIFIFAAEILGEIFNFYGHISGWDTMLHTVNGFLCAAIGFALVDLLNRNSKNMKLSPFYLALVAFCFSMTVGVCWEFIEFSLDRVLLTDCQKGTIVTVISSVEFDPLHENNAIAVKNIAETVLYDADGNVLQTIDGGYLDIGIYDTMKDLFVNFIGAVVFSFIGYFYIKYRGERFKFSKNFIPTSARKDDAEEKNE